MDLHLLTSRQGDSSQNGVVAKQIRDFWANFIQNGNRFGRNLKTYRLRIEITNHCRSPTKNVLNWPPFREESKKFLLIGQNLEINMSFRRRQEQFWTSVLKGLRKMRQCDQNQTPMDFGYASGAY